jgi:hypothetical protein
LFKGASNLWQYRRVACGFTVCPLYHPVYNNNGGVKGRRVRPRLPGEESATLSSLELLFAFQTKTRIFDLNHAMEQAFTPPTIYSVS